MHILEMEWKIQEKSSVFQIRRLKLFPKILQIAAGILVIGSQCVSKQS